MKIFSLNFKTISKWMLFLALTLSLSSCFKDLDLSPKDDDNFTNEKFFASSPESYKQFIAKIYGGLAVTGQVGPAGDSDMQGAIDEGFSQYLRGYWQLQELTTDEAIIAWGESDNPTIKNLNFNDWNADNRYVAAFFARIFFQVGLCNEFLRETTDAKLSARGVSGALKQEIQGYRNEARFLRALSYYHGIEIFGKVPFATDADLFGTPPNMQSRAFVFDYITSELNAIESQLSDSKGGQYYGRATKAAAWMLLSKLYLNSKVYTGVDRSALALENVNKVIGSGYTIAAINEGETYGKLFAADNDINGAQNEAIFTVNFDGIQTQSWGGMTYLVHGSCGPATAPSLGIDFAWQGFRPRQEFFTQIGSDKRVMTPVGDASPASISDYSKFDQGKKAIKFSNKKSDGTNASTLVHCDADFPLFRLADAYLMYAELAVVNGQGSRGQALEYVNALRTRAGEATVTDGDLTADFILDERARELYWEGHRRQDLIRFEKYITGYTWQWKGGTPEGKDLAEYRKVFPIPNRELSANSKLSQNLGY